MAAEHLFVYYRVGPQAAGHCEPEIRRIQSQLAERFGCRARLMRSRDDTTLLEIYEGVDRPEALLSELETELAAIAFERWLAPQAGRHVERFKCA